nr:hypothetical protein [Tanacetum cinerariifolium]
VEVVVLVVLLEAVGVVLGGGGVAARVCSVVAVVLMEMARGESGMGDQIDRETGSLFGFAGKNPPEKYYGGSGVVAGGGGRLARVAGGGGLGEK